MIERFQPASVPPPGGPYSAGIKVGDLLYLAGQGPFDKNGERVGDTFAEQTRATFDNLELVANAAGTSLKNAVRIGAYLSTLDYFEEFNTIMAEYVNEPFPARTTIPVALTEFDVEIDAVVFIPEAS
ncbi:MAG TPA: RidA family protein [Acidimicrobiales bacterium]|jgi:reactive intermediate/imine deaminase|nr:RidA family protein [Acidimicrobiales bacterium]